jgi:CBS domain containing-hemolysin-like protein
MSIRFFKKKRNNKFEEIISEDDHEIEQEEREMIRGIFGLGETTVRSIMVPRTDVVAIPADEDFSSMVKTIIKSGHSRIPVYGDTIDNIKGFLYAKDLLSYLLKGEAPSDITKILRPVRFLPEGKMIDDLLKELQQKKEHIAIVVDEYGGMAGIVCLEDILEEIVGEIQDEYDNEEEEIKSVGVNMWVCDARTQIQDINEALGTDLAMNGSDTLGGFVFNLFGKIPVPHEEITYGDTLFRIETMDGHSIKRIRVRTKVVQDENEGDQRN